MSSKPPAEPDASGGALRPRPRPDRSPSLPGVRRRHDAGDLEGPLSRDPARDRGPRIGNGAPFPVGTRHEGVADATGTLTFSMNDVPGTYFDNRGRLPVRITLDN